MNTLNTIRRAGKYRVLRVELTVGAADYLREIAEAEKRTPQQQASYLLERQLRWMNDDPDICQEIVLPARDEKNA